MFVWDPDPVLFHLGPLQIRWYGLLFATGLMGGFYLWRWQARRGGYDEKQADRLLTLIVIAVILGARLGHVFFYEPSRYLSDPWTIIEVWKGGLASHGATIGVIVAMLYYARTEHKPFFDVMDRFAMAVPLASTMVRMGNFMNSEIVGRLTDGSWGIRFPLHDRGMSLAEVPLRHPSQLYEAGMGLVILAILYLVDRVLGEKRPIGFIACLGLVLYFGGRFTVEFFKAYQTLDAERSAFTMGQFLSMPFFALGLAGIIYVLVRHKPTIAAAE